MSDTIKETKQIDCYCSRCKHRTHHVILGEAKYVLPDPEYFYEAKYRVVKCCGCDQLSFDHEVVEESNVTYSPDGYIELVPTHTSYPIKEGSVEALSSWNIPQLIRTAYQESVAALNDGSLLLASIGFRTTIEALCLEKGINSGKLATKINRLKDKGIITATDCDRLHEVRFMGNESAHQIEVPDREHVLIVLDVINSILNSLYIIDEKFKEVFEYRFRDYNEFQMLVEKGIDNCTKGDEKTIYSFLPEGRKYRKKDLDKFEEELQKQIKAGAFTRLSVLPKGKSTNSISLRQVYKVE